MIHSKMSIKGILILTLIISGALLWPASGRAERRLALIIGNGQYANAPLANAINDARLMADRLKTQKFEVYSYYDATQKEMKRAVIKFAADTKNSGKNSVALIYYSGHGVQVKGENYLIPSDARIASESDVDIESVSMSSIMSALERSETRLKIIILDACRTNPFGYARSGERGLARVDAPSGSIVAFSTSPGKAAQDGEKANSPYTEALAAALTAPGLKIEDVFKRVRVAVMKATNDEQTPWESTSLTGDFYPAGQETAGGGHESSPTLAGSEYEGDGVPSPRPTLLETISGGEWATGGASNCGVATKSYTLKKSSATIAWRSGSGSVDIEKIVYDGEIEARTVTIKSIRQTGIRQRVGQSWTYSKVDDGRVQVKPDGKDSFLLEHCGG